MTSGGPVGNMAIQCFYTLGEDPSITFQAYRGTGALAALERAVVAHDNIFDGQANEDNEIAPDCTPAKDGQCTGKDFGEHSSSLVGLGQKAFDDPGGPQDGANVEFIGKGETFKIQSSEPYLSLGPNLAQVLAFVRLIMRSGYTLSSASH